MIPIAVQWSRKAKVPNLPELAENVRLRGGSIIQYVRIESILIVAERSHRLEWLAPGQSRRTAGMKHALCGLLLGLWSAPGMVWTPAAVVTNLLGGVDVTESFVAPKAGSGGAGRRRREKARQDRIHNIVVGLTVLGIAAIGLLTALYSPRRK